MKSNKSISRNFLLTKFHFLQFQNIGQKSNFELGKKFKTAKNAMSQKNDLFDDVTSFFAWTFFKKVIFGS